MGNETTSEADATPEWVAEWLRAGARYDGTDTAVAAVHLLTFTELPHRTRFVDHLRLEQVRVPHGVPAQVVTVARVDDWPRLLNSPIATRLGSAAFQLLTLAAGLASGQPVDLRDSVRGLGHTHARRVVEAVAIATGYPRAGEGGQ